MELNSTSEIVAKLGLEPNGDTQWFFTNTCYKKMDKYVPMDKGNLRGNVDIQADKITYESEYAKYQYYGQREDGSHVVKNYTTAGTGPYWDRRMVSAEIDDVIQEVEDYIRRR